MISIKDIRVSRQQNKIIFYFVYSKIMLFSYKTNTIYKLLLKNRFVFRTFFLNKNKVDLIFYHVDDLICRKSIDFQSIERLKLHIMRNLHFLGL